MRKRRREASVEEKCQTDLPLYSSSSYWDERYSNNIQHEWYFNYDLMRPLIMSCLKTLYSNTISHEMTILEIGCGGDPLATEIARDEFPELKDARLSVEAIDFSQKVISDLNSTHSEIASLKFTVADARKLPFAENYFNFIVEKGTIDAVLCDRNGYRLAKKILSESVRVLDEGGQIMLISHMSPESTEFESVLEKSIFPALKEKENVSWSIVAHEISNADESKDSSNDGEAAHEDIHPTVYVISCGHRPRTRSVTARATSQHVSFKVLSYDLSN